MGKIVLLLSLFFSLSYATVGNLRIIVDFGSKFNISKKPCNQSTKNDMVFINDDQNDTASDVIKNASSLNSLYLCSPDLNNNTNLTTTINSYKDFRPTIILFNDQGIKGTPSLYNKKLLSNSNVNTLLLTYKNIATGKENDSDFYNQLSKFNIDHFYLAITPDLYDSITMVGAAVGINKDKFYTYLESLPNKLKDDKLSEKEFEKKIKYIKELYSFGFDSYSKIQAKYSSLKASPGLFLQIWKSGFTEESFCNLPNGTYESSIGYQACKSQGGDESQWTKCFKYNCGLGGFLNSTPQINEDIEFSNSLHQEQYGVSLALLNGKTAESDIYNFKSKIPYTNITSGIVKNSDESIDVAATLANRNSICRGKLEENLANTFHYYSKKYVFKPDLSDFNINVNTYPLLKNFSSISMDVHTHILTNDIGGLIDDNVNKLCYQDGDYANFYNNKKLLSSVSVLKNNMSSWFHFLSKIFALNLRSGNNEQTNNYDQTVYQTSIGSIGSGAYTGSQGGIVSNGTVSVSTSPSTKCAADENVMVLFFASLSNTLIDPTKINNLLNQNIASNQNYFDVQNNQVYIGCYKDGYITKFLDKKGYSPTFENKESLLSCFRGWLSEPDSVSEAAVANSEGSNATGNCLTYFYNGLKSLGSSTVSSINSRFNSIEEDNIIFGVISHFNIYNSDKSFTEYLNGPSENSSEYSAAPGTFVATKIFQNVVPTHTPTNSDIEIYDIDETICQKESNYEEVSTPPAADGKVTTTKTFGVYKCIKNISNQNLVNFKNEYQKIPMQDYMMVLNSYSPVKLKNLPSMTPEQKNSFSLNEQYPAFSVSSEMDFSTLECPFIYYQPTDYSVETYQKHLLSCYETLLKLPFSDYNTDEKKHIKSVFSERYISKIIQNSVGTDAATATITEDQFYTDKFVSASLFAFSPAYKTPPAFNVGTNVSNITDNDQHRFEINQLDRNYYVNMVKNKQNTSGTISIKNDMNSIDTSKFDIGLEVRKTDYNNFISTNLMDPDVKVVSGLKDGFPINSSGYTVVTPYSISKRNPEITITGGTTPPAVTPSIGNTTGSNTLTPPTPPGFEIPSTGLNGWIISSPIEYNKYGERNFILNYYRNNVVIYSNMFYEGGPPALPPLEECLICKSTCCSNEFSSYVIK